MNNPTQPNAQYYVALFEQNVETRRQLYIEERGNDKDFDAGDIRLYTLTPEEIVGYYLTYYGRSAYKTWLAFLESKPETERQIAVTNLLARLFEPSPACKTTVKDIVDKLTILQDQYEELQGLIADQVRDNQITKASNNLQKLQLIQNEIERWEATEIPLC